MPLPRSKLPTQSQVDYRRQFHVSLAPRPFLVLNLKKTWLKLGQEERGKGLEHNYSCMRIRGISSNTIRKHIM